MQKLFGGILMAVGILIAGASGLCSLTFLVMGMQGGAGMLPVILIVGGVPFAIGLACFYAGRSMIRWANEDSPPPPPKP